jgi:tRNA modification GTPase
MSESPTIAARLTPRGPSALAAIAVYGPHAFEFVSPLLSHPVPNAMRNRPVYRSIGRSIQDDVVLHVNSTGDEVEIFCHGGSAMVDSLLADLAAMGAAMTSWQHLERCRGRTPYQVDVLEALSRSEAPMPVRYLLDQWTALDQAVEHARVHRETARAVLQWADFGRRLVHVPKIVLFGAVNAGKSSLLNALAGFSRAIVHESPGTTRDLVRLTVAEAGWPMEVIDGAGFRREASELEQEGLKLIQQALEQADLRVLVEDGTIPENDEVAELRRRFQPEMVVMTKADLPGCRAARLPHEYVVSARTGFGLDVLRQAWVRCLYQPPPDGTAVPFTPGQVADFSRLLE